MIRAHAFGRFSDLLPAGASHPAMLHYLNQARSPANHGLTPNENFAREVLELHTVGSDGGYDEDDIKAVAHLLSGWSVVDAVGGFTLKRIGMTWVRWRTGPFWAGPLLDQAFGAFVDRLDSSNLGDRVTIVTMTEFGRRVAQNDSDGTDHGYGSPMLVIGGGVRPGVHGVYPGVAPGDLIDGDLAVTVDQRTVLSEILAKRLGATNLVTVFPGFATGSSNWVGTIA